MCQRRDAENRMFVLTNKAIYFPEMTNMLSKWSALFNANYIQYVNLRIERFFKLNPTVANQYTVCFTGLLHR